MRRPAVCCAVLVVLSVLAGCSLPSIGPSTPDPNEGLGYEAGYNATDSLPVTTGDGLNASERDAVLARTMARVEEVRGLEFEETVTVELVTREEYQSGDAGTPGAGERALVNQRWEALFTVGEDADATAAYDTVFGDSVVGFYSNGRIVIVSDSETPTLDTRTLAHELLHALQDQHLGFGPRTPTFDGSRAREGLVEGDANYVESLYSERCESEWDCLARPDGPDAPGSFNRGIYQAIIQPYVDGPAFVRAIHDRGGWEAVNDAYEQFPDSTEQTIHPARYPDEPVADVTVADESADDWTRLGRDPPTDRLGEVGVYTMLQTNGVLEDHQRYDYSHPASTGWAGDQLVPYRNAETGESAYVWRLAWDSEGDAREFVGAYRDLLTSKNATRPAGDVYVVPSGPYADAFRVTRDGATVTVVNAPTRADLDAVHGSG
ncbi:Hvo_1808 family surface protein [Halomarina salina]|uniref:Hvo_1808 family surface protein n=1 Tax=Halomarina salina TaxID=1872699 RepID=A0ABD5RLY8_9EURY|nr:Hvo_1808 family surface protein [Halomarina salina]